MRFRRLIWNGKHLYIDVVLDKHRIISAITNSSSDFVGQCIISRNVIATYILDSISTKTTRSVSFNKVPDNCEQDIRYVVIHIFFHDKKVLDENLAGKVGIVLVELQVVQELT